MIDLKLIEQIRQAPVAERIQIIELILQSLKDDAAISAGAEKPKAKPFSARRFNLGQEMQVDRDELYSDRGV
jgi:hypothetical protein